MNAATPSTVNALINYRRIFRAHVGAVVLTAAIVVPLLLGIASIPSWVSVACCVVIATIAIAFVTATVKNMRLDLGLSVSNRFECLLLTLGLSVVQAIFVLPVLICVYTPTLRV